MQIFFIEKVLIEKLWSDSAFAGAPIPSIRAYSLYLFSLAGDPAGLERQHGRSYQRISIAHTLRSGTGTVRIGVWKWGSTCVHVGT